VAIGVLRCSAREAETNAIIKEKKKRSGRYDINEEQFEAEIATFNAAYAAAQTPQAKYAVIRSEKQAMVGTTTDTAVEKTA
jgi:hypothetical protein